jgi:hypothetical protein
LEIYGKNLLDNVLFDVTQQNCGCYPELKESYAELDKNGNFVQDRFHKLSEIQNKDIYNSRLDVISYLGWVYSMFLQDENFSDFDIYYYRTFLYIYNCQYDKNKKKNL